MHLKTMCRTQSKNLLANDLDRDPRKRFENKRKKQQYNPMYLSSSVYLARFLMPDFNFFFALFPIPFCCCRFVAINPIET